MAELLQLVRQNDMEAAEELAGRLVTGVRLLLRRRLGSQDFEGTAQDVVLEVLTAIKQDRIRQPGTLATFVRTVAMRRSAAHIDWIITDRARNGGAADELDPAAPSIYPRPDQAHLESERLDIARRALASLRRREQEVLRRFYVDEQSVEQICRDMNLTETQFRLLKPALRPSSAGSDGLFRTGTNSTLPRRTSIGAGSR